MKEIAVKIRPEVFIWGLGILAVLALSSALKDLIIIFFLAFIISSGFRPIVDRLQTIGIPRTVSLVIIYLIVALVIAVILLLTIETFINQFNNVNANLPNIIGNILLTIQSIIPKEWGILTDGQVTDVIDGIKNSTSVNAENLDDIFNFLGRNLQTFSNTGLSILSSVTNLLFSLFIVTIVSAYLVARPEKAYRGLIGYIPKKTQEKVMKIFDEVEKKIGEWIIGQIILMFVVGFLTYIAVMLPSVIGIEGYELHKFALIISIMAGILEAFPNIGPTVTLILTLLMAIGTGSSLAIIIYIFIIFMGIQQAEAVFIVPMVMKRAVNLDPVIVILAISAGFTLGGVIGAILSIPIVVILKIILDEVNDSRIKLESNQAKVIQNKDKKEVENNSIVNLFRKFF